MTFNDPIDRVKWLMAESLSANHYNPNFVMDPELQLLERSILTTGWIQPVLIQADERWIIDGFHRWRLSIESAALRKKYGGRLPCAELDVPIHEAIMVTVRINRAKGTHAAARMSDLVKLLIDKHSCDPAEVARGIGATREEVDLLYQDSLFHTKRIKDYRYSRAWVPHEDGRRAPAGPGVRVERDEEDDG